MRNGGITSLSVLLLIPTFALAQDVEPGAAAPTTQPAGAARSALADVDLKPTRVTLDFRNASPEAMLERLGKQAGVTFLVGAHMWNEGAPTLDAVRVIDQPFWIAFNEVSARSGVRLGAEPLQVPRPGTSPMVPRPPTDTLTLEPGRAGGPVYVDGPFLFRATSLHRQGRRQYGAPDRVSDDLTLGMQMIAEPRLRGIATPVRVTLEEAVDEAGNSFVEPPQEVAVPMWQTSPEHRLSVRLATPHGAGKRLSVVRGRVDVAVPRQMLTVEIPKAADAAQDVTVPAGPHTLVMKPPTRKGQSVRIELNLRRGKDVTNEQWFYAGRAIGLEPIRVPGVPSPRLVLETSAAALIEPVGRRRLRHTETEAAVEMMFPLPRPSTETGALRITCSWEIHAVSATFEFKDLPLPRG